MNLLLIFLAGLAAASNLAVKKMTTASFDNIPTGAPPSPYKGLQYNSFTVQANNDIITPNTGNQYASATGLVASIAVPEGSSIFYILADSLYLGCIQPVGSAGSFDVTANCTVTVVADTPDFNTALTSYTFNFVAPNPPPEHGQLQKFEFGGVETEQLYFLQSGGSSQATVFIDSFVYSTKISQ